MLLISYEHYEHFYYKFINSTYLINSELWTVSYNDMTMTWTITPLASLNCSAAAAAAIARAQRSRDIYGLRILRCFSCCVDVVIVVYRCYIGITLLVFWVNFPNHNDNKDRWGTGHIRGHIHDKPSSDVMLRFSQTTGLLEFVMQSTVTSSPTAASRWSGFTSTSPSTVNHSILYYHHVTCQAYTSLRWRENISTGLAYWCVKFKHTKHCSTSSISDATLTALYATSFSVPLTIRTLRMIDYKQWMWAPCHWARPKPRD